MRYHADIHTWESFQVIHFESEEDKEALRTAERIAENNIPGGEVTQLWGHGKLLWKHDEGWLPEHKAL
jgi:hypothetical protein